jgi:hypothetical protein
VPTSADEVHLADVVPGPTIDPCTAAEALQMRGPGEEGATSMDINEGSFTTSGYWSIGHNPDSNGTANVFNNATVTVGTSLYAPCHGSSTLNVGEIGVGDNSTIDVAQWLYLCYASDTVSGYLNLYSGTLNCNDLTTAGGKDILIDIYEGALIVRNKSGTGTMQGWIDLGLIVGYGGTGVVVIETTPEGWDKLTAKTETNIVDDFESYADSADLRNTWVESKTGVVHLEETIAHDGNSMKIVYDGASPYYYEAVRTYGTAKDWTIYDRKALDVWFRGKSTNDAEQMYVTLSDGTNSATVVNDDPNTQSEVWQVWHIELQDFTDVNMAGVEQISIGIGNGSSPAGSGEAYFDDVALFEARCFEKPTMLEGNLNGDCVIDLKDFATLADNWLKEGMWP